MNQSKAALEWLCYDDFKLGENRLRHVRNGGEQKVITPGEAMFVDGYDEATKTVYEFHGCLYYGCLKCFPNHRQRKHNCHPYRTISEVYEATCQKTKQLRQAGYTVIEKWGHDFEVEKKTNPTLINFLTTFGLSDPFNPRDSFFGGRTNGVRSHCVAEEGEEIHYVDINSLHPYVNKTKTYPVGHPDILVNPVDQDIGSYFGIAKVNILPPPQLYHPVLPKQINSKLMFPLCTKCAETQQDLPWLDRTKVCSHTNDERAKIGTWSTPKLHKAVELGKRIVKIYEVWNFPEDQRKEGLFADYVNRWLKNKTEASGWPKNCVTEEAKTEYIHAYYAHEGVQLEPEKVAKNGGRKQVAKLMLNR